MTSQQQRGRDLPPPAPGTRYDVPPPRSTERSGPPKDAGQPASSGASAASGPPEVPGPPPPPSPGRLPSDDGTSRSTAASWVAATGALFLLVAAGTFLAVSWDALGLTARVAIVGSITGAAIIGGHRLRSTLPAVGAVIFHLGALLLPIDAVGLGLQLDLSTAAIWIFTGVVAVAALPPLAIAGRSRTLAAGALAGVPAIATGVGLTGAADPALVVAGAAAISLLLLRLRGTRVARVWRTAPAVLASTAVVLPLIAAVLDISLARGQVVAAVRDAGWAPTGWVLPTVTGVVAVAAVAAAARLQASRRLATLVPVVAAIAAIVAILPEGTPRLAALLAGPVGLLLLQAMALLTQDDASIAPPFRTLAVVGEIIAGLLVLLPLSVLVVAPSVMAVGASDGELTAALLVAVVAWALAGFRRMLAGEYRSAVLPVVAGFVVLHAAGALAAIAPASAAPVLPVLLLGAVGIALLLPLPDLDVAENRPEQRPVITPATPPPAPGTAPGAPAATSTSRWQAPALVLSASVLVFLACAAAFDTTFALPIAAIAAPLVGLHIRALLVVDHPNARLTGAFLLPGPVVIGAVLAWVSEPAVAGFVIPDTVWVIAVQMAVSVIALLGTATAIDRFPILADGTRLLALVFLVVPGGARFLPDSLTDPVMTYAQMTGLDLLQPIPMLVIVLLPALVWLAVDAVRLQRTLIAAIAAPVALRTLGAGVAALGVGPIVLGIVVLAAGLVALAVAIGRGTAEVGWPAGVFAVLALPIGWSLVAAAPEAQAIALIALGTVGVIVGVVRRSLVIGHGGGIVATLGIWSLFDLLGVTGLDLWLLPVAVQLVAAGMGPRRRGTLGSWAIDVPPLLLVAIPALGERLAGGPGIHTLLAGAVALIAVIYGGASGRGGPLTVGMLVVLAVVGIETVAFAALVPTWAWFGAAGAVLIAAAILIERHGLSPSRAADRLRDLAGDARQSSKPSARGGE